MFTTSSCGTCSNRQESRAIAKAGGGPEFLRTASAFLITKFLKVDYFAAGVALDFDLALAAGAAGVCNVALRARLRSLFLALDLLRVFSRALSLGMMGLREIENVKTSSILRCCRKQCRQSA